MLQAWRCEIFASCSSLAHPSACETLNDNPRHHGTGVKGRTFPLHWSFPWLLFSSVHKPHKPPPMQLSATAATIVHDHEKSCKF